MRFAMRPLALLGALAVVGAAAPPAGVPPALAALATANGHPATVHVRAARTRLVEQRTVVTTLDRLGTASLLRNCVEGVCGGTWFDGRRRWRFGLNDVPLPEADDDATRLERTVAAIESFAFAEPSFAASGGSVAADGPGRWRVRAAGGPELVAVVDPRSGALLRIERAGAVLAAYDAPVRVGGAAFPVLHAFASDERALLASAAAVAAPIVPPAGPALSFSNGAPAGLAASALPVVPCTLAGVAFRCLLDSGSTPSSIALPVAERLGLEPHGELQIQGIAALATGFVETGPLVAAGARFASARFAVVPPVRSAPFDVVVGADLLGCVRLRVDRVRRLAVLEPPGDAPPGATALDLRDGTPAVEITLAGAARGALLDTGDEAALSIGYASYREGPQWPLAGRASASGLAGSEDAFLVDVPDVKVGARDLGALRVLVRRTQPEAHVGIAAWNGGALVLDERAGAAWLDPASR